MDLGLADRIVCVTGASTGIGRAAAIAFAAEGARVVAAARSIAGLQPLADAIRAAGGFEPVLVAGDLARADGAEALASQVIAEVGHVDVLVNNAGGSRPLERPDDAAAWAEAFVLNFDSARQLTQHLLPGMVERRWGRVVCVSGAVAAKAINAAIPAKAALESWARGMAAAHAADGVTFNCVAPGRINSVQILSRMYPTEAQRSDFIARNIPAGRFGEPSEAAALIVFLASRAASYINGVTIPVDGGMLRYTL
jgi:3-oxoacyl-[acyl-carrier protein] reductase